MEEISLEGNQEINSNNPNFSRDNHSSNNNLNKPNHNFNNHNHSFNHSHNFNHGNQFLMVSRVKVFLNKLRQESTEKRQQRKISLKINKIHPLPNHNPLLDNLNPNLNKISD